jgi:hypothetical protein
MKRWLWLIPGAIALGAWVLWGIFTLAAWGEGPAEPSEARFWRTVYFLVGIGATVIAGELRRRR